MNDDIFGEIIGYLPTIKLNDMSTLSKHYYHLCEQLLFMYPISCKIYPLDDTFNAWKTKYNKLILTSVKAVSLANIIEHEKTKVYLIIDDTFTEQFKLRSYYDDHARNCLSVLEKETLIYGKLQNKFKVILYYFEEIECFCLEYLYGDVTIHVIYIDNLYDLIYRYCYFYGNYHAVDNNNIPFDYDSLLNAMGTYVNQSVVSKRINIHLQ